METHFKYQRRAHFVDTDMAGIAHFSNFFRYMEEAEHAFLRARGLSVVLEDEKGRLGFPKLEAHCDYVRPLRYDDLLDIDLHVCCEDGKTIRYDCHFQAGGASLARGYLTVAFCRFPAGAPPYALPIPEAVLAELFSAEEAP